LTLDTFVILGDQTDLSEFNSGAKITVQNSGTGSPLVTNNGTWTVDRTFYNGGNIVALVAADDIADTFTIDGNYADKFIPGFEFTVYDTHGGSPVAGGSPSNAGNYIVRLIGSPGGNIGATYDIGTDTTIIPVSTSVPGDFVSGSPYSLINGMVAFSGTDETFIYVTGEIITDLEPHGRIQLPVATNLATMSSSIIDTLRFGWTVDDWFQYPILQIDLYDNSIILAGDARGDLQIGQDFEILGAPTAGSPPGGSPPITNNGLYVVRIDEVYREYYSPVTAGTGYNVGDELEVVGGTLPMFNGSRTRLRVTQVGGSGEILRLNIINEGLYQTPPTYPAATTTIVGSPLNTSATVEILSRSEVDYDGSNTTVALYPDLTVAGNANTGSPPSNTINGWVEPNNDAVAIIAFADVIGMIVVETADAAVITGGSLIGAFDYPYWDVGGYDEDIGTIIHLYSGTFE
jgi:hypothetical protein